MAKKLEVGRDELQRIVTELESKQTFPHPSALWKAVEETQWAKSYQPRPVTAAVAYGRAKELGIRYQTSPAKRGIGIVLSEQQRAAMQAARKNRKPRAEKMRAFARTFADLRKLSPPRYLPLVDQAEKGSLRAAIKLNCLECSNFQVSEVKSCPVVFCAMFPHRPYQGSGQEAENIAEQEDDGDNMAEQEDDADDVVAQEDDIDE
jgi:hypothetical protein